MLLVNIELPKGLTYNQAKEKMQETLRGSVGYIKGGIRIRPISGESSRILLELGDPKDSDVVIKTTASEFFARTYSMERLGEEPQKAETAAENPGEAGNA